MDITLDELLGSFAICDEVRVHSPFHQNPTKLESHLEAWYNQDHVQDRSTPLSDDTLRSLISGREKTFLSSCVSTLDDLGLGSALPDICGWYPANLSTAAYGSNTVLEVMDCKQGQRSIDLSKTDLYRFPVLAHLFQAERNQADYPMPKRLMHLLEGVRIPGDDIEYVFTHVGAGVDEAQFLMQQEKDRRTASVVVRETGYLGSSFLRWLDEQKFPHVTLKTGWEQTTLVESRRVEDPRVYATFGTVINLTPVEFAYHLEYYESICQAVDQAIVLIDVPLLDDEPYPSYSSTWSQLFEEYVGREILNFGSFRRERRVQRISKGVQRIDLSLVTTDDNQLGFLGINTSPSIRRGTRLVINRSYRYSKDYVTRLANEFGYDVTESDEPHCLLSKGL